MDDNLQLYLNMIFIFLASGLINYWVSGVLSKKNKWLVFIIPGIVLSISSAFLILGITANDDTGWAALGYLLIFGFTLLIFIGTLTSSIICFIRHKVK
ncbi:hypothetical protein [Acholeplasma laidlawii]|uniref:hypothetical protein n=1 Tax=Acholeplasma laidlawii TaxID=2148 RepID=UPI0018C25BDC|nr:hypothetical protein [Acholeplasma laidlawii]